MGSCFSGAYNKPDPDQDHWDRQELTHCKPVAACLQHKTKRVFEGDELRIRLAREFNKETPNAIARKKGALMAAGLLQPSWRQDAPKMKRP